MSGLSTEVKKELYELYKYYHQQQHDSDSDDVDTPSKVVRTDESEFYPNSDTGIILEANYKGIIVGLKVEYDKIFKRFNVEGLMKLIFLIFLLLLYKLSRKELINSSEKRMRTKV